MLLSECLVSGTVGSEHVLQDIVGFLLYQFVCTLKEGGREGGREEGGEGGRERGGSKKKGSGNFAHYFLRRGTLHISMSVTV